MGQTNSPVLLDQTTDFLKGPHGLLIGGAWVEATLSDRIFVENPALATPLAKVSAGGARDIDQAVSAARAAFEDVSWRQMPPSRRGELLWALADLIEKHGAVLTQLEILDNGMPQNPAGALAVPLAAQTLRYYAGWPNKITGLTIPADARPGESEAPLTYTRREPVGVVGQIIPWNYPLGMAVMKLGPALATGCTLVLKPAEQAPLSALYLGRLIDEAGFPPGVVNIVTGYGAEAGAALAAHPGVNKVAFTGSTKVGKEIIRAAAGNLKRVSLELGGKSPFIVFPDADIEATLSAATHLAFFLQGQNCFCPSRFFIHDAIYESFSKELAKRAAALPIGPGWMPETRIGPLISKSQQTRVADYLESGHKDGARALTGGAVLDRPGYFVPPTVFTDVDPEMAIVREEIFGPVTTLQRFSGNDLDAIAAKANDTDYGLVASIWTKDLKKAHSLAARIEAGVVGINHHGNAGIAAPLGGFKQSGWGREFGAESLDLYLESKSVVTRY